MLPILLGAIVGYLIVDPAWPGQLRAQSRRRPGSRVPNITLPGLHRSTRLGVVFSIALIAIATIPESTAHLYQMSLYIDQLAKDLGRTPTEIKKLIGLNLVADGADDLVVGMLGGCAGTNYGENNSLMAITRNYSVPVLMTAGVIAILLGFVGKLAALVEHHPGGRDRRPGDLPVRRHRHAGCRADPERAGQPVRSEEPGHRRDDPGPGHRRQPGPGQGRPLPVQDPGALPERHPGHRVRGHRRHPAEPALRCCCRRRSSASRNAATSSSRHWLKLEARDW